MVSYDSAPRSTKSAALPFLDTIQTSFGRHVQAHVGGAAAAARDPDAAFGVALNPPKHRPLRLAAGDKIIVLADD